MRFGRSPWRVRSFSLRALVAAVVVIAASAALVRASVRLSEGVSPMVVGRGDLMLPAPFCEWLRGRADVEGWESMARLCGVDSRRLRTVLRDYDDGSSSGLVRVRTVDEWLIRAGGPMIHELYGELYAIAVLGETDAARRARCLECGAKLREPAPLCGFCANENAPHDPVGGVPSGQVCSVPGVIRSLPSLAGSAAGG